MWKSIAVLLVGLVSGSMAYLSYLDAYAPQVCDSDSVACEMEWLRGELDLSEEQFVRISRLHHDREKQIRSLSRKVRELELMLAEFEAERVRDGYVDYLEMRDYLEAKRKLDEACARSTSDLIASVGELMNLEQRKRYFSIVEGRIN